MKGSIIAVAAVAVIAISGCAAKPKGSVVSTGPGILVQDQKPAGYPSSRVEKDDLGNCTRYADDYVPGLTIQGHKTWNKVSHIESLGQNCPVN